MGNERKIVSTAKLQSARLSARKARYALDMIRGKQVESALQILQGSPRKASALAKKLLLSAIANANQKGADVDNLWVSECYADQGKTLKRSRPRARGVATMLRKRSSHMTIKLGE